MPKPGYTQIIVSGNIRNKLEEIAKSYGFRTVNQFLEQSLDQRVNPRVNPNYLIRDSHQMKTNFRSSFFLENKQEIWRARGDLNPGTPAPQASVLILARPRAPK